MKSQVIERKQDLTALSWAKARQSSGTAGSFLKSFDDLGGRKVYYKLSDYDPVNGIIGHECINEIVVCRLLEILGVEHVDYQLIHADVVIDGKTHETWLNASEDFKRPGESKVALDTYYALERQGDETPLEFCIRHGWGQQIWECLVVDFLIRPAKQALRTLCVSPHVGLRPACPPKTIRLPMGSPIHVCDQSVSRR